MINSMINWKKLMPTFSDQYHNPFFSFHQEIDKAFNGFYNMFNSLYPSVIDIEKLTISPSVDIVEDDHMYKIEIEMPGMGEEDIRVSINNRTLCVNGKKEISKQDHGKDYVSREIGYGSYEKIIPLPEYINVNEAKASFKKGMLWVTFPKNEVSSNQRKEITVEKA